jgi:predicted transcriptional regulator
MKIEPIKYRAFPTKIKILQLLSEGHYMSTSDIMSRVGIKRTHTHNCLRDLKESKWITSKREGKCEVYSITDLGKAVLEVLERGIIRVIQDDKLCEYLSLELQAPKVDGSGFVPISAIFKEVNNTYQIDSKGYYSAILNQTLIQLKNEQGIITPVICGEKEPIIKWNGKKLELAEFTKHELDASKIFSTSKVKSHFYSYKIHEENGKPLTLGKMNYLTLGYNSRLILCKLSSKGRYGFCLPIFYAMDETSVIVDFSNALECLEEISANTFTRRWVSRNNVRGWSEWEGSQVLEIKDDVDKTGKITLSHKVSIEKWDEYIILKRNSPDLLHISFKIKDDNFLKGCAIFSESFRKPFVLADGKTCSLSFLCGNRACEPSVRY